MDLIIKNGTVIDGTGTPARQADIAVRDGRIADIAPVIDAPAARVIDAAGRAVTPGFIDVHRHADFRVFDADFGEPELRQGLTTIINGNCGLSAFPVPAERREEIHRYLAPILGYAPGDMHFPSAGAYFEALGQEKRALNAGILVGNGIVRAAVGGFADGVLTDVQEADVRARLNEALDAGAAGVALGILYQPECYYDAAGYDRIFRDLSRHDTVITAHIRGEGANLARSVAEVIGIAERAGVPIHISHFKQAGGQPGEQMRRAIEHMENALARGVRVTCDMYPYNAGSTMLSTVLPPEYQTGGAAATAARLRDPDTRREVRRILEKPQSSWDNILYDVGFDAVQISSVQSEANRRYVGMRIPEIARARGVDEYTCAFDLLCEEEGQVAMIYYIMADEDIVRAATWKHSMFISDAIYSPTGRPHPRRYGAFARVLREFVRERGLLRHEDAVHRMSGRQAAVFGLRCKGVLAAGMDADINIYDPAAVTDHATYSEPERMATGFDYVLIGGREALRADRITGEKLGCPVRRGR